MKKPQITLIICVICGNPHITENTLSEIISNIRMYHLRHQRACLACGGNLRRSIPDKDDQIINDRLLTSDSRLLTPEERHQ